MAAALAIFEPFLRGCTPDQAGLFGAGTSQTEPSIAYIPYIRCVLSFCGALTGHRCPQTLYKGWRVVMSTGGVEAAPPCRPLRREEPVLTPHAHTLRA